MIMLACIVLFVRLALICNKRSKIFTPDKQSYLGTVAIMIFLFSMFFYASYEQSIVEHVCQENALTPIYSDESITFYIEKTNDGYYHFLTGEEVMKSKVATEHSYVRFKEDVIHPYVAYYEDHYYYSRSDKILCDFGIFFTRDRTERHYVFVIPGETLMTTEEFDSYNQND